MEHNNNLIHTSVTEGWLKNVQKLVVAGESELGRPKDLGAGRQG